MNMDINPLIPSIIPIYLCSCAVERAQEPNHSPLATILFLSNPFLFNVLLPTVPKMTLSVTEERNGDWLDGI